MSEPATEAGRRHEKREALRAVLAAEPPALDVVGIVNSFRYSEPLGRTSEEHRLWERNEETLDAILARLAREGSDGA